MTIGVRVDPVARPKVERASAPVEERVRLVPAEAESALAPSGKPLANADHRESQARFGFDFARVRVHADQAASRSAPELRALASTVGDDVVGGGGGASGRLGRHSVRPAHDPAEAVADRLGARIEARAARPGLAPQWLGASSRQPVARPRSDLAHGPGSAPHTDIRLAAERELRKDLSGVRVHADKRARTMATLVGARALTHRGDIFLGETAAGDRSGDVAHELVHAAHVQDDDVYLRSATWIERRTWLAFFNHYLPRKFLNNYMDDTGKAITLTRQEMIDCNPV